MLCTVNQYNAHTVCTHNQLLHTEKNQKTPHGLDQFYLYKTFDGEYPTHNAWEVHRINPNADFRSFWADAVVITDFKKTKKEIRLKATPDAFEAKQNTVDLVSVLARQDEQRHDQLKHLQSDIEHHAKGLAKHLRPEQLSQGVLTQLCKMFTRTTIDQASHNVYFDHTNLSPCIQCNW